MEKSMVLVSPLKLELQEFEIPQINRNEALLKVIAVGVCSTDVAAYQGKFTRWPLPLIMGHEVIGKIVEIGDIASKIYKVNVGDTVAVEPYISCGVCEYCSKGHYQLCVNGYAYGAISCTIPPHLWGGYSQYMYIAPGSHIHKIPKEMDVIVGTMVNVISNGIRWICTKGRVNFGDTVVILGPGVQGLSSTLVAKEVNAKVILAGLSKDKERLQLGKELGADFLIYLDEEDIYKRVSEITNNKMADVCIVCAPSISAIEIAPTLVKRMGRVVIIANTEGKKAVFIPDEIVWHEIEIVGGLGQSDANKAIEIISKYQSKVRKMISKTFNLKDLEEAFKLTEAKKVIKAVILP